MVFVWSNATLSQVALNDAIMVVAFVPIIVGMLLGLSAITVPWDMLIPRWFSTLSFLQSAASRKPCSRCLSSHGWQFQSRSRYISTRARLSFPYMELRSMRDSLTREREFLGVEVAVGISLAVRRRPRSSKRSTGTGTRSRLLQAPRSRPASSRHSMRRRHPWQSPSQ